MAEKKLIVSFAILVILTAFLCTVLIEINNDVSRIYVQDGKLLIEDKDAVYPPYEVFEGSIEINMTGARSLDFYSLWLILTVTSISVMLETIRLLVRGEL